MQKTTVYLSDELKRGIERLAREEGCSEADVIRTALGEAVARRSRPRPTVPLWADGFGGADVAERIDEVLTGGFGRDAAS
jgi:hypothetical protein